MPQSNTGSVTQECRLQIIKDGDQFQLLAVSGCTIVDGNALKAELPPDRDRLAFCVTDFDSDGSRYVVRAASAFRDAPTLTAWTSPAPGEHWSPWLVRESSDPQVDPFEVPTVLSLEIFGPVVVGAAPSSAGTVRPPTTVLIRLRLEDPTGADE